MNFHQRRRYLKDVVEAFHAHIKLYPNSEALREGLARSEKELAEHNSTIGKNHKR